MQYQSKRAPRIKQAEALERIKDRDNYALLMAMRTGKTKVVLDDWGRRCLDGLTDLLVIAPAGVYQTWNTAIDDDLMQALSDITLRYIWTSGSLTTTKAKAKLESFLAHKGPRVLLMNIEALSAVKDARDICCRFLRRGNAMLVIDESVVIKNHKAKRTKFINRELAPLAKVKRILSGLPTPRSPLDLFCQYEFLDPRILRTSNFYSFRARYAVIRPIMVGGRQVPTVIGYRNTDELQELIAPHSFRVLLEDCYDLPPSTYSLREVSLTKEQREIYASLKENATAALGNDKHVTATVVIAQLIRMHQVLCGHTRDEQGDWHAIPENRTKELLALLDDYDGKAIIWCSYDADVTKVAAALRKEYNISNCDPVGPWDYERGAVARFWGGNIKTRESEEDRFKHDPRCRFMVATAAAGGRGRTWDCADLVVYYSNTNDLDHRSQSEERAKAVNKTRSIAYIDMVAPGTIDEKIINALRNKIDMAAAITGDTWREWLI